ncbi:MAG: hypothetical protein HC780_26100 [Leptolyngbyaceae cyanobacterium CSU_1_3]|nr:hypothetical protein [Leptolyngbyaceae cyanobacterium CSU_1_3]
MLLIMRGRSPPQKIACDCLSCRRSAIKKYGRGAIERIGGAIEWYLVGWRFSTRPQSQTGFVGSGRSIDLPERAIAKIVSLRQHHC